MWEICSLLFYVFRALRKLFKVDPADYMLSLCGDDALRELSSPGKSGSFFYLTNDDRYMIKTMKKSEGKVSYLENGCIWYKPWVLEFLQKFGNIIITMPIKNYKVSLVCMEVHRMKLNALKVNVYYVFVKKFCELANLMYVCEPLWKLFQIC